MNNDNRFIKIALWILILSALIILIVASLNLYDSYISLKYEVQEPKIMGKFSEAIEGKEDLLRSLITWLWILIGFTTINIIVLVKALFQLYGSSRE